MSCLNSCPSVHPFLTRRVCLRKTGNVHVRGAPFSMRKGRPRAGLVITSCRGVGSARRARWSTAGAPKSARRVELPYQQAPESPRMVRICHRVVTVEPKFAVPLALQRVAYLACCYGTLNRPDGVSRPYSTSTSPFRAFPSAIGCRGGGGNVRNVRQETRSTRRKEGRNSFLGCVTSTYILRRLMLNS